MLYTLHHHWALIQCKALLEKIQDTHPSVLRSPEIKRISDLLDDLLDHGECIFASRDRAARFITPN